jgi:hypothetical protein
MKEKSQVKAQLIVRVHQAPNKSIRRSHSCITHEALGNQSNYCHQRITE